MQSTLNPRPSDDPHDFVVVAPEAVRVAPAAEELANLAHEVLHYPSDPPAFTGSGAPAGSPIPSLDATFRAAAADNLQVLGRRSTIGTRAMRAFIALFAAACMGAAAIAWQSHGDAVRQIVAKWAPPLVPTSSPAPEKPELAGQQAAAATPAQAPNPALPPAAPPAQTGAESVAPAAIVPSPESTQLLQSMAHDLASVGQQIEQLKASIEELRASQQQLSRDVGKVSERNLRPRTASPPRWAAAPARRPMPPYPPPQVAAAPTLPQTAASQTVAPYYVPRSPEPQPQAAAQPQADADLSVPRPPMPLR